MTSSLVSTGWEHHKNITGKMSSFKNKHINYYLSILFIFSVFYLFEKHTVGNDSTISEWLINYEGGFTKRGLIGQLCIFFSDFLDLKLRQTILLFQIIITAVYFFLLSNFFSNLKLDKLVLLSIFSPIFILYPVAEIEVLARKETFIFILFLSYFFLETKLHRFVYKLTILPLCILIWEPVIFFFPFWLLIDLIKDRFKIDFSYLLKSMFPFLPSVIVAFYIALNPISEFQHNEMANFLKENFNENCYMSCSLLLNKSTIFDQFSANFPLYSFKVFFRYFLILIIGFGPLIILIYYSKIKKINKSVFIILIIFPVLVLFSMMSDWGRIVNIFYTFSILTYIHLLKKKLVIIDQSINQNFFLNKLNNKKIFIFFFIIFAFGWNPKTSITGDVASKPGYQIPRKAIKIIYYKYINN